MNVKQYATLHDMSQEEVKTLFNLPRWNSKVPDVIEAPANEVKIIQSYEAAQMLEEAAVTDEAKRRSVNGLGTKSPFWKELRG